MPRWMRYSIVAGIAALTVVLMLAFRHDPLDIRTGTVSKPAAAFVLDRLDGTGKVALADHAGKVVVLNFFASWCLPCKEENPALVRVWERYRSSDVVVIGILYQDSLDSGRRYMRDNGVTWPTATDEAGRIAFAYGVRGIPETYFIGPDGIIAGRHVGPINEGTLVTAIESLRPKAQR
jgi:cytochrome c biogenesis protein CcmG/thiol:disulfide interchange protein DsbE